ncbi:hypothetical protein ABNF97_19675 [Plantactinospora sp. B6F1]|uniref:hypothetical protein n=1 Tax=Plantactinospora sp. B6F1 TaxID=3158971 RepID=UPI0032D98604
MPQPQPEETAPAGRATPPGPPPAEDSATVATGDRHARTGARQDSRADQQKGRADDEQNRHADQQNGPADHEQNRQADDEQDHRADGGAPQAAVGGETPAAEEPAAATERDGADERQVIEEDAPTRRTPAPDATRGERPDERRSGQPVDATRIDQPAEAATDSGPAEAGTPVPPPLDDEEPAPTRVAAPRWTGSAAVPPPRPRKRRWFRGDAEDGGLPAAPTAHTHPADPTLRMPDVEADEDEIPTPVDPWAGAADDPWDTYPPFGGHPGAAPHPPIDDHPGAAPHPPFGSDAPVSPPPARQLPVTRRFPAPTGPPSAHPGSPPHQASPPHQVSPPHAAAPPPAAPQPVAPPPPVPQPAVPQPPVPAPPATWGPRPPAAPAPRKQPLGPPRPVKQRRQPEAPPAPPPLRPVRRRRRWPRVMFMMTLLSIACCCGIPAYYVKPIWDQYPASPADPLPSEVLDLRLLDNASGRKTAERLKQEVRARNWFTGEAFAGVYRASNGKVVTIFGSTGFQFSPESVVQDEVTRLKDEYAATSVESVPTGVRGEYRSCGTGRADGDEVVVCTWADYGSSGTALFTRLSIADSSELLSTLRDSIVVREPVGSNSGSASSTG